MEKKKKKSVAKTDERIFPAWGLRAAKGRGYNSVHIQNQFGIKRAELNLSQAFYKTKISSAPSAYAY